MAPQTRSAAKSSPGRSTRNSLFGRAPLPLPKPRNSPDNKSSARNAPAHDTRVDDEVHVSHKKGTPWLACRDAYGVMTTVAVSDTGEGVHVRWYYPEDDIEVDEDEETEVETAVDEERGVTPVDTTRSSSVVRSPFLQTPMALQSYDAGSVIRTPVKKVRPLEPSPPRIGDKGVRCLYENGGVLRELNGATRIVLRHPVGTTANLSRAQVERLEDERAEKIFCAQMDKLLAETERLEEEETRFLDSGYEDGMDTRFLASDSEDGMDTRFLASDCEDGMDTDSLVESDSDSAPGFFRGPNGELLDRHGRLMLGREGTILTYSSQEEAFTSTEIADRSSPHDCAGEAKGLRRPRFGPEGTELID